LSPAPRNVPAREPARNVRITRPTIPQMAADLERKLEAARIARLELEAKQATKRAKKKGR
jgi:hypothetical protein